MQVHPSQISPGESFDIFYFIRNHTDSTTYYVRGVVYDVRTGEVLSTVNLDQSPTNARLFIKTLQAPPDPVGYGRNIVAIATVYTDSNYTTKSQAYEEQEQYYLIKAASPVLGGGGIDYRTLREIVQEEVASGIKKLPPPPELKLPDQPDMSFVDALFGTLGALQRELNRVPKEGVDLSALETKLEAVRTAIINLPAPQKLDLTPITSRLDDIQSELSELRQEAKQGNLNVIRSLEGKLKETGAELIETLRDTMDKTLAENELSVSFPASFSPRVERPTRTQPNQVDVSHLMNV
jgi:hypothetical protein